MTLMATHCTDWQPAWFIITVVKQRSRLCAEWWMWWWIINLLCRNTLFWLLKTNSHMKSIFLQMCSHRSLFVNFITEQSVTASESSGAADRSALTHLICSYFTQLDFNSSVWSYLWSGIKQHLIFISNNYIFYVYYRPHCLTKNIISRLHFYFSLFLYFWWIILCQNNLDEAFSNHRVQSIYMFPPSCRSRCPVS